jgi:uncharacterized membrane protein
MALPSVSIPSFPLPFHVPVEIHPCVVHLAVALPLVILLLELVNLVAKKRPLGVFSFVLMVLLAVILFGAYLTGTADAEAAGEALKAGPVHELFEAHKTQGIYLVYSALVLVVIKLLSVLIRKTAMRVLFLLFLIAFTALTLNTAKKGKALVFNYGVNVKAAASKALAKEEASSPEAPAAQPTAKESAPKSEEKTEAQKPESSPGTPAKEEAKTPEAPSATSAKEAPTPTAEESHATAPAEEAAQPAPEEKGNATETTTHSDTAEKTE